MDMELKILEITKAVHFQDEAAVTRVPALAAGAPARWYPKYRLARGAFSGGLSAALAGSIVANYYYAATSPCDQFILWVLLLTWIGCCAIAPTIADARR